MNDINRDGAAVLDYAALRRTIEAEVRRDATAAIDSHAHDMAARLKALQVVIKTLDEQLGDARRESDALQAELDGVMTDAGIESWRATGIGTVSVRVDRYPRVDDEETFFEWLAERGEQAIIKRSVHAQTLRGYYNRMREDATDPDEFTLPGVSVCEKRRVRVY